MRDKSIALPALNLQLMAIIDLKHHRKLFIVGQLFTFKMYVLKKPGVPMAIEKDDEYLWVSNRDVVIERHYDQTQNRKEAN